MALNERACRGKLGGDGLAILKNGDDQCTCPLTREEIKSDYLPKWEKKNPEENDITNWKCPTCKHDFAAHATGNFHIPLIKLSWYFKTSAKVILLFAHRCNRCRCDRYVYCPLRNNLHILPSAPHVSSLLDQRLLCVLVWTWSSCSYVHEKRCAMTFPSETHSYHCMAHLHVFLWTCVPNLRQSCAISLVPPHAYSHTFLWEVFGKN